MKKTFLSLALLAVGMMVMAQSFDVMEEQSTVKWTGKKVGKEHYGKVSIMEGSFEIQDNRIVKGQFVMDMNTISSDDIKDEGMNNRLVGHLKSDDFFSVEAYPEAKLVIAGSEPFTDGKATVKGDLIIKGKSHPISFDVVKKGANYTSNITFDRSLYDVRYGSGKFFSDLGDKAISDKVEIEVILIAMRQR